VFEFLVGNKADIDALDAVSLHPPTPYPACTALSAQVGATPLHFAVRWGSESIVKFILRKKVKEMFERMTMGPMKGQMTANIKAKR
jgi:hypothetical protein